MKQELKERLARLGQAQATPRVSSGSPADLVLRPADGLAKVLTIFAIRALAHRNMPLADAKAAIEHMVERGEVVVHVPTVDSEAALAGDLAAAGVAAGKLGCAAVDVAALRARLGLSQEQFAVRYGLDLIAVQSWEQGSSQPDKSVKAYLRAISAAPDAVARAQEEALA